MQLAGRRCSTPPGDERAGRGDGGRAPSSWSRSRSGRRHGRQPPITNCVSVWFPCGAKPGQTYRHKCLI
jgi:hypothetical protein